MQRIAKIGVVLICGLVGCASSSFIYAPRVGHPANALSDVSTRQPRAFALRSSDSATANDVGSASADHDGHSTGGSTSASGTYSCPMHPEVVSDEPGRCPKCGMSLVKKAAADAWHAVPDHGGIQ